MSKQLSTVTFHIPEWVSHYYKQFNATADTHTKMQFVIDAARENIAQQTGGPFAAAIFEENTGELVALGVNLVTTEGMSMLHAEMVAISLAQKKLGTYDLGQDRSVSYQLVTSTEPCAMCLGAILWSGVRTVIAGATDEDARKIGFDEGPKPSNWVDELNRRGIKVIEKVERTSAADVLTQYLKREGHIYNSREDN